MVPDLTNLSVMLQLERHPVITIIPRRPVAFDDPSGFAYNARHALHVVVLLGRAR